MEIKIFRLLLALIKICAKLQIYVKNTCHMRVTSQSSLKHLRELNYYSENISIKAEKRYNLKI